MGPLLEAVIRFLSRASLGSPRSTRLKPQARLFRVSSKLNAKDHESASKLEPGWGTRGWVDQLKAALSDLSVGA